MHATTRMTHAWESSMSSAHVRNTVALHKLDLAGIGHRQTGGKSSHEGCRCICKALQSTYTQDLRVDATRGKACESLVQLVVNCRVCLKGPAGNIIPNRKSTCTCYCSRGNGWTLPGSRCYRHSALELGPSATHRIGRGGSGGGLKGLLPRLAPVSAPPLPTAGRRFAPPPDPPSAPRENRYSRKAMAHDVHADQDACRARRRRAGHAASAGAPPGGNPGAAAACARGSCCAPRRLSSALRRRARASRRAACLPCTPCGMPASVCCNDRAVL